MHLFTQQACLLTNLSVGLFIWRYTCFHEAADTCPAIIITADTLAPSHNQYVRRVPIWAQEKAGDDMWLPQGPLRTFPGLILPHPIPPSKLYQSGHARLRDHNDIPPK